MTEQTTAQIAQSVLTEMQELSMRAKQPNTENSCVISERWKTLNNASLIKAQAMANQFLSDIARDFFGEGHCLSIVGKSGIGKTFLAKLILEALGHDAWHVCRRIKPIFNGNAIVHPEARFFDWRRVSDKLKAGEWGIVEAIEECPLVVLDDIGADHDPSGIATSKVDRILRSRSRKWTIITCNLNLEQIADRMDTRITSFLIRDENKVIEIEADDYALTNQNP